MRLRLLREAFDDADFVFELKHDGFRGLVYIEDQQSRLGSGNQRGLKFASLKTAPQDFQSMTRFWTARLRCVPRHTSQEFVNFLEEAVAAHRRKTIHVILDNLAVHKAPVVQAWAKEHPKVTFHFTPTYASWLNQIEIWLGMITRDCIRRGVFHSVSDLAHQIMTYIRSYNRNAQPFHWTYRNPRKRIRVSPSSVTRH